MMIPGWMKEVDIGSCECSAISHGKKSFVGKTIDGILGFMEEAFVSESFSKRDGLLQSLDPRAKLISILALVFATTLIGDLRILIFIYLLTLLFSYLSKIDVLFFIKRVWLFIPIFAGIIAIPMIFNFFFPGDPLIRLANFGCNPHLGPFLLPDSLYITRQGLDAALIFTIVSQHVYLL
jgi:cobalt/nickel transport system permease protein